MLILIVITLFPIWWVVRTALTSPKTIFDNLSSLLPVQPTTDNFARVVGLLDPAKLIAAGATNISPGTINFIQYMLHSVVISTIGTAGQIFFSALSAYAFARLRFPGRNTIFYVYLTGLMVPGIVLLVPNYVLIRQLGWVNTFQGIIAPSFLMTPFAVFCIRQFFMSLNKDLEEAARLDGASVFGIFWRVALPLSVGPLLTLGLVTFINSWNDYLWPLLVGQNESVRPLTVALGIFRQQTPQGAPDWTGLMAGALVSVVPIMLLFVFFGRKIVDSIQFSGGK
ncbi:MAG: carbohydrate ABC transporter permease [Aggregatilineales bacterium]